LFVALTPYTLTATSTPSIELDWITPFTPTTSISNPATSAAIGVYTLTAFNPNNGCLQTYTVPTSIPTINVLTSPSK
jgi:hypothetical protein